MDINNVNSQNAINTAKGFHIKQKNEDKFELNSIFDKGLCNGVLNENLEKWAEAYEKLQAELNYEAPDPVIPDPVEIGPLLPEPPPDPTIPDPTIGD